ncbi:hypothetical protein Tco_0985410 [Tanacetum coccineum]
MGGGAWPFLVGGAICLVNSVNERDLSLLTSYVEVCDAFRCSGRHERYTDVISDKKRGVQHEDFPAGHPSQYYSRPSTLNCEVLMGSGALVLGSEWGLAMRQRSDVLVTAVKRSAIPERSGRGRCGLVPGGQSRAVDKAYIYVEMSFRVRSWLRSGSPSRRASWHSAAPWHRHAGAPHSARLERRIQGV